MAKGYRLHGKAGYIHAAARFFEVFGGALRRLMLKPTSGRMLCANPTDDMKKRGAMTRKASHAFSRSDGTRYSRNTRRARGITTPRARRLSRPHNGKRRGGGRFVCAGPKASYGAENGACELRSNNPIPANNAPRRARLSVLTEAAIPLQTPLSPFRKPPQNGFPQAFDFPLKHCHAEPPKRGARRTCARGKFSAGAPGFFYKRGRRRTKAAGRRSEIPRQATCLRVPATSL